ncbi:2-amino-4-hydroxy-6-hydroxymethyldihydropteridine diphosphokinase [Candidatus Vondammii sp. HM_W22]|uniref:2-amino-4-hydroxy-6- hydroxymethyldihydropteridine diphosphokinase n=1 Tax=Candidatus Vondammii sp. HM_W22 TaxID=2687299 RepID=UPI001F137742|nr:2-amino-4-hydroxy-6-hydroxymethyldihydropteridine diphosphokinase [Candidatus Vondammii sp. HM_W22]
MPGIWLSLGSNIDRSRHIHSALKVLGEEFGPLIVSPVYESEAVGFDGDAFYNLIVGIESDQPAESLMAGFRVIEVDHGRARGSEKFSSRTLDIDLLTYGDCTLKQGKLELPRDEILRYAFVLLPLSDVAGDEVHPLTGKCYRDLWEAFDRKKEQLLWRVSID